MSKRKPPKNLRPYATPSGKKARMVPITDHHELAKLYEGRNDIGTPQVVRLHEGEDKWSATCFVNADELAKWRASQTTSGEK
jgi:hypothetical protein